MAGPFRRAMGGAGSCKYLIIALASLMVTMALYEYPVRRVTALRTLSGLKPPRRAKLSGSQVPVVQPAT